MKWFSIKVLRRLPIRLFYSFLIGCLGATIAMVIGLPLEWLLASGFGMDFEAKWLVYAGFVLGFLAMFISSLGDNPEN